MLFMLLIAVCVGCCLIYIIAPIVVNHGEQVYVGAYVWLLILIVLALYMYLIRDKFTA
jgi:hypothetical protein